MESEVGRRRESRTVRTVAMDVGTAGSLACQRQENTQTKVTFAMMLSSAVHVEKQAILELMKL